MIFKAFNPQRDSKIRITALWPISTTNWNCPHFSPEPVSHGKKCGKFQFVVSIAHKTVILILLSL